MVPRVYVDTMNCSSNGTNVYFSNEQNLIPSRQQLTPKCPLFYSSSQSTPLTQWIPTAPSPPYFVLPNRPRVQQFPFQQLI